jgi:maleylacetoacetate isomerase
VTGLTLYGYFRSSAAFRVRIALNLKGLDYEQQSVHLAQGHQLRAEYRAINPQALVPVLVDGEHRMTQSLAIIEYLDELHPEPALLPQEPLARQRVRSLAQIVASDIHPINNTRVLKYLGSQLKIEEPARNTWYRHWIAEGLAVIEKRLIDEAGTGVFCHGDAPTIADCCLVPQIFNARRYGSDLNPYPTVMHIYERCMALPAFDRAAPLNQQDADN